MEREPLVSAHDRIMGTHRCERTEDTASHGTGR